MGRLMLVLLLIDFMSLIFNQLMQKIPKLITHEVKTTKIQNAFIGLTFWLMISSSFLILVIKVCYMLYHIFNFKI